MPKVSIIVLTYNRQHHLDLSLLSLAQQTYRDFEVIVADAGSEEKNLEIAEGYKYRLPAMTICYHPHTYVQVNGQRSGVMECAKTANMGLQHASGEIMQFLQQDHILSPLYLMHLVNIFTLLPRALLPAGAVVLGLASYLPEEVEREDVLALGKLEHFWPGYPRWERFFYYGMDTLVRCPDWRGIDGFDCAIRREFCLPFDEAFKGQGHEHMDWVYRLAKQGTRFLATPLLHHYHQPHTEIRPAVQWNAELDKSYKQFEEKHGEGAWKEMIG